MKKMKLVPYIKGIEKVQLSKNMPYKSLLLIALYELYKEDARIHILDEDDSDTVVATLQIRSRDIKMCLTNIAIILNLKARLSIADIEGISVLNNMEVTINIKDIDENFTVQYIIEQIGEKIHNSLYQNIENFNPSDLLMSILKKDHNTCSQFKMKVKHYYGYATIGSKISNYTYHIKTFSEICDLLYPVGSCMPNLLVDVLSTIADTNNLYWSTMKGQTIVIGNDVFYIEHVDKTLRRVDKTHSIAIEHKLMQTLCE